MSAGTYTHAIAFLTRRALTLEEVVGCFPEIGLTLGTRPQAPAPGFPSQFARRELIGLNGVEIHIDVLDQTWPETFDQAGSANPWGPFTESGGLSRALKFENRWPEAEQVVRQHQGAILLRLGEESPDTKAETRLWAAVALAQSAVFLKPLDGLTAYFCPGGEVLWPVEAFVELLNTSQTVGIPPLDLLAHLRLAWLDENWVIFETVGNTQLAIPDIEVYADSRHYDLNEIASWLRRWSVQLLQGKVPLENGTQVTGPGERLFQVVPASDSLQPPRRDVLRMIPQDGQPMPQGLPQRLRIDR